MLFCHATELFEVDCYFLVIPRNVDNMQSADTWWPIKAVTGISTTCHRNAHYTISWMRERREDSHGGGHPAHKSMISIGGAEQPLQKFHAQGFEFVDVTHSSEEAPILADMSTRCTAAKVCGQIPTHGRASGSFCRYQIHASPT